MESRHMMAKQKSTEACGLGDLRPFETWGVCCRYWSRLIAVYVFSDDTWGSAAGSLQSVGEVGDWGLQPAEGQLMSADPAPP